MREITFVQERPERVLFTEVMDTMPQPGARIRASKVMYEKSSKGWKKVRYQIEAMVSSTVMQASGHLCVFLVPVPVYRRYKVAGEKCTEIKESA